PAARHLGKSAKAVLVFPSIVKAGSIGAHVAQASQITHRDAMNDQQEAAPRPNGLTLDPTYRGFTPIPNMGIARPLMTTTPRKGIYAFAFGDRGLIGGLRFQRKKITAVHPD